MNAGKKKISARPPLEGIYIYVFLMTLSYFSADLAILHFRDLMIPSQAPPSSPKPPIFEPEIDKGQYLSIMNRHLFNFKGEIPEPLKPAEGVPNQQRDLPPIPTAFPLNLIGTLVHSNPEKSIAAIELRGKNQIVSYRVGQEIPNMAVLEKVERMKAFIRNLSTERLEYVEMKATGPKINLGGAAPAAGPKPEKTEVQKVGDNNFVIKRSDLAKYLNDLPSVLMQARSAPARKPNGDIYGFRILDFQPGSIYEQLGIQPNDVIKGVNGTNLVSPAQAMELFNALKNSSQVAISVERNGRDSNLSYSIK